MGSILPYLTRLSKLNNMRDKGILILTYKLTSTVFSGSLWGSDSSSPYADNMCVKHHPK